MMPLVLGVAGAAVGFYLRGPTGSGVGFLGTQLLGDLIDSSPRDYTKVVPRQPGIACGPIIDCKSPVCAYCGRFGDIHTNCAGCGAQVRP